MLNLLLHFSLLTDALKVQICIKWLDIFPFVKENSRRINHSLMWVVVICVPVCGACVLFNLRQFCYLPVRLLRAITLHVNDIGHTLTRKSSTIISIDGNWCGNKAILYWCSHNKTWTAHYHILWGLVKHRLYVILSIRLTFDITLTGAACQPCGRCWGHY